MPLYEFKCDKCSTIHEKVAKHDCGSLSCDCEGCDGACFRIASVPSAFSGLKEKRFYPNGKDMNETIREAWEKPKPWQHDYEKRIYDGK